MNITMNLSDKYFNLLNKGIKDIEVRLLDEKRSKIKTGDIITFTNSTNSINTIVKNIIIFSNINDLLCNIDPNRIGLSTNKELAKKEISSIYSEDKLSKFKVIAIEIKRISDKH